MNWTDEKEPNDEVSYTHVKLKTPLGCIIIDWKGWKDRPSYDISLENEWIGSEFDLENAKNTAENYLREKLDQLNKFINEKE